MICGSGSDSVCAPLFRFHSHSFSLSAVCRHYNSMLYCTAFGSTVLFVITFRCFLFGVRLCECHYTNLMNELRSHSTSNVLFHYFLWLTATSPKWFIWKQCFCHFQCLFLFSFSPSRSLSHKFVFGLFSFLFLYLYSAVDCKLCEYSQWMDLRAHIYTCKM